MYKQCNWCLRVFGIPPPPPLSSEIWRALFPIIVYIMLKVFVWTDLTQTHPGDCIIIALAQLNMSWPSMIDSFIGFYKNFLCDLLL